MYIYLVSRWGNDIFLEELNPDLECTKDSNLLVRAKTWQRAVKIANGYFAKYLENHECFAEFLKNGEELCDNVFQLATDTLNETEEVIHGPFISHGAVRGVGVYKNWGYDVGDKVWRKKSA